MAVMLSKLSLISNEEEGEAGSRVDGNLARFDTFLRNREIGTLKIELRDAQNSKNREKEFSIMARISKLMKQRHSN